MMCISSLRFGVLVWLDIRSGGLGRQDRILDLEASRLADLWPAFILKFLVQGTGTIDRRSMKVKSRHSPVWMAVPEHFWTSRR